MTDAHRSRVVAFFDTHPINEDEILAKLLARGANLDALSEVVLKDYDQDHYGGVEAVEALGDALALAPGDHVLDICSGMGGPARWLAHKYGCRVTGLDLTPSRVAGAKRLTQLARLDSAVGFFEGDATAMPFQDSTFSAAVGQESWCHIPDKAAILAECARVLRPGGRLAFTDIMTVGALSPADEDRLLSGMSIPRPSSLGEYMSALAANGFSVRETTDLCSSWKSILVARLEMYRSLRDTTVAKFGEARFAEYDRAYAHFVGSFVGGALGGYRILATLTTRRC